MMDFCRRTAAGAAWRDAFAAAFGLTVDAFYARFEADRPALVAGPG